MSNTHINEMPSEERAFWLELMTDVELAVDLGMDTNELVDFLDDKYVSEQ